MNLTNAQLEAVKDRGGFLAITAGAGSGKTKVLVERVSHILLTKLASLDQILAITFTEKAAAELKKRLTEITNDEIAVWAASIGTFHSFCSRIIREDAPFIGIDPDFGVMDEHTAGILARKTIKDTVLHLLEENNESAKIIVEELDFKDALTCLEELIEYRWHTQRLAEVRRLLTSVREDNLTQAVIHCFNEADKAYSTAKSINLDFQDLEIFAIRLLEQKDIRAKYQKRFKYILVDEFQDINDTQSLFISLLYKDGLNSLTVVGDSKQSIYRFRGANVSEFNKALKSAKKVVRLKENFRSMPGIISFVNETLKDFEPLIPTKEAASFPVVGTLIINSEESAKIDERRLNEALSIAGIIPSLTGATACLFNSLKSVSIYTREFSRLGIPYKISGGTAFLEKQEIVDIINALRVTNNHNDLAALLGLARSPYIGLTDEEIYLLRTDNPDKNLFEQIRNHSKGGFLNKIIVESPHLCIHELISSYAGKNITDDIEKLCHIAFEASEREKISLKDFIEYLLDLKNKEGGISEFPAENGGETETVLMTIHQAKGLEFDNVILCDTIRAINHKSKKWCFVRGEDTSLAFKLTPEDNPQADPVPTPYYEELINIDKEAEQAERKRLLYVAMTRAKERLIIPIHPGIKKDGDWHKLLLKQCLSVEVFKCRSEKTINTHSLLPFHTSTHLHLNTQTLKHLNTVFTVSELETYADSPQKYYKNYVLKSPIEPLISKDNRRLSSTIHGDIVHKMIEYYSKGLDSSKTLLKNVLIEIETNVEKEQENEILKQFEQYRQSRIAKIKDAQNEVPFLMKIGNNFVKGKLDMLIYPATNSSRLVKRVGGGVNSSQTSSWEIVDFKTGHSKNLKKSAREYELQINTYALAVAKATGVTKGRVTLLFLSDTAAAEYTKEIDNKILKETENKLGNIIKDIANGKY